MDERSTRVNITISDYLSPTANLEIVLDGIPVFRKNMETGEQDEIKSIFPGKMRFLLKPGNLSNYMNKIAIYSFLTTIVIALSFFTMLRVIKKLNEDHALAQSISPVTIGLNLIWNFFFFAINFQFTIQAD